MNMEFGRERKKNRSETSDKHEESTSEEEKKNGGKKNGETGDTGDETQGTRLWGDTRSANRNDNKFAPNHHKATNSDE